MHRISGLFVLFTVVASALATGAASAQVSSMTPVDLSCESRVNPLGVDVAQPRLSWVLRSDARGQVQAGYRIVVASSADALAKDEGDLWDSGEVKSDQSLYVSYAGKPMVTAQQAFWKVRSWDGAGKASAWSAPATWTMGVVDPADWGDAKWISAEASQGGSPSSVAGRAGRGYHAGEASDENEVKWVQVDLGEAMPIEAVRLHTLGHEGDTPFGFPIRFKVEASDDAEFAEAKTIADKTDSDFPSPGMKPVSFGDAANGASPVARYVRVTVNKMWKRNTESACFALGQIEVVSGGKNVAVGKTATAKDSVEMHGWSLKSLTDGKGLLPDKAASAGLGKGTFATLLLRREFDVKPGLKRAVLLVSGLGYYEMTLNGARVTEDVLSPGWTKYTKTVLYGTYDVTKGLRPGKNAAGLFLGNGMYNVPKTPGRYTKFDGSFGPQRAIAQLRLDYADGSTETLVTDDGWRVASGPVTFTNVFGGEDYDARLDQKGWDKPGFDDASWDKAITTDGPGGALRGNSYAAPPLRRFDLLKPVKVRQIRTGVASYDLGQNASQMPTIKVRGPAGSSVRLVPSEVVKGDGSADQSSTGGPTWMTYTLAGNGSETWSPRFFYSGYRHLQVELNPATQGGPLPVVEALESSVVHTSSPPIGQFTSSNELFNKTYTLVRWAQRSNMVSVLTDCPHREKLGWLEQIHLNGPALRYNFDLNGFFTKTMNDMADSQLDNGLVPTTAPEYPVFGGDFRDSPEWGSAILVVAAQQYEFTGDDSLLRRYYEAMARYVDYLGTRANGHIVGHGLSDWYDIGPGGPGFSKLTPKGVTATAFYYYDTQVLARTAKILGLAEDVAKYEQQAKDIREAFNAKFFNADTNQYSSGSQCANAMPLVLGIAPEEKRSAILENIVKDIDTRGLTAGDVGYKYLLNALADGGRSDVIFKMNNQSDKPGYGMQLKKGATSLTEAWDAFPSSSQNHFMLGQINEWFFRDLAGIRPDTGTPGFKKVVIKPAIVGDLKHVKVTYDSVRGPVVSEWTRAGQRLTMNVTIPANTTATVYVPAVGGQSVRESGKPAADAAGVKFVQHEDGAAVFDVGSGAYAFTSEMPK